MNSMPLVASHQSDPTHSSANLPNPAFDSIALPLIIDEMLHLSSYQTWIFLGAPKTQATQANTVTLTERAI
jgi:hypothetical protein